MWLLLDFLQPKRIQASKLELWRKRQIPSFFCFSYLLYLFLEGGKDLRQRVKRITALLWQDGYVASPYKMDCLSRILPARWKMGVRGMCGTRKGEGTGYVKKKRWTLYKKKLLVYWCSKGGTPLLIDLNHLFFVILYYVQSVCLLYGFSLQPRFLSFPKYSANIRV